MVQSIPSTQGINNSKGMKHKPKTRSVSAIRDFPPFCGPNAPNPTQDNRINTVKEPEVIHDADALIGKSGLRKTSVCSIEAEDIAESVVTSKGDFSGEEQGTVAVYNEVAPQHSTGGERLTEFNVTLQPCGSDKCDKNSQGTNHKFKTRRVSAVRDFPPFCGPNAPNPTQDNRTDTVKEPKVIHDADALIGKINRTDSCSHAEVRGKINRRRVSVADDEGEDASGSSTEVPPEVLHNGSRAPFGANASCHSDACGKVREALRLFQLYFRELKGKEKSRREEEAQCRWKHKRADFIAVGMVKSEVKKVNREEVILGEVPGIEVGDEFQYRAELNLVGLHRPYQAGIDTFMYPNIGPIAVSIVASGAYGDDMNDPDVLVYSSHGGNVVGECKTPEDKKLITGNLGLKNSISVKNPVRVIRRYKEIKPSESVDARRKEAMTFVYDGLYIVTKHWKEEGKHVKKVYKFKLRKNPGQAYVFWREVKSSMRSARRHGICVVNDITGGKELLPIRAINRINSERPPKFTYIKKMRYSKWFPSRVPKGCECTGKCSDSKKCACAIRNGGVIPYNHDGAIVEVKPLVYECGPRCKCPPSCYNRVSQKGIKIQLEIFKTKLRGWGVRSQSYIPSGTFICEYVGELLEDNEAELRIGKDEYLYDIGQKRTDDEQVDEVGYTIDAAEYLYDIGQKRTDDEQVDEVGYTIDAAEFGNVGRFINHSCSPNLYAQDVLYDYEDENMRHIMLFAAYNIPPLQELTFDYNYKVDSVRDSNGNIVVKECFCGSAWCTGRLY